MNIFKWLGIIGKLEDAVNKAALGEPVTVKTFIGKVYVQIDVKVLASK